MGFFFSLKDANIVAYLTDRRCLRPPRLLRHHLWMFLGAMHDAGQGRQFYEGQPRRGFVSSGIEWIQRVDAASEQAFKQLNALPYNGNGEILDDRFVGDTLAELRRCLSQYDLFGLTIRGDFAKNEELNAFALHAAYSSGHRALFLITDVDRADQPIEFLDPFPALRALGDDLGKRPGMLFWTADGLSVYAPLSEAQLLYGDLLPALLGGTEDDLAKVLTKHRRTTSRKRILHLSDLHLGTEQATENQELLLQQLVRVLPSVDRIVITGDLFDEPKRSYSIHFKNFKYALGRLSDKPAVIVPGNHDQKRWGNVAPDLREIAELEWEKVVVDDDTQSVFFCFDSSRDADLARGKVTKTQKRDVAVEYEARANARAELRRYLNVALVHHHPFTFQADEDSLLNRSLKFIGKSDEDFLCMQDGDEFVDWCARRDIPLILHGHKHVPRHVHKQVELEGEHGSTYKDITAIGCGTSLGAEGKALSYNILNWDPDSQRWGVSYFADPGDGSGFVGKKLVVATD